MVWDPFGTLAVALARGRADRRIADRVRRGDPPDGLAPDAVWVDPTPEEMAAATLAGLPQRFTWALDDLRVLVSWRPVLAEGSGAAPGAGGAACGRRGGVVRVPTEELRRC